METRNQSYGNLISLDPDKGKAETIQRMPLKTSVGSGGIDEALLQDLLFRFPETLPVATIDASYGGVVPVCRELATSAGYVDALYVNQLGRLMLAEFKLWRNPQARREVIGQILDYTQAIASWNYEDLQREVSKALGRKGNVLFELVRERFPGLDEAEFVDNVTRKLRRGEFLLLIIGDGIREGVENIVNFVQRHSGLHFNLALIEAALYRDKDSRIIVQPRVLARTEIVRRVVFDSGDVPGPDSGPPKEANDALSDLERQNVEFWKAVLDDYSFSDVTVEIPAATKESALFVRVANSGFNDWGLSLVGYLSRSGQIGCYLACRKNIPRAVRVFNQVQELLDELREELGDSLQSWTNQAGRPRIGFRRKARFPLLSGGDELSDFSDAVRWMRDHLDRLVSALHPRLQRMLRADN